MAAGRQVFIGLLAAAALLVAGAGPAQATTTVPFEATWSKVGCNGLCGTGFVAQFGSASIVSVITSFTPGSPCFSFTAVETITVVGGTLTLSEVGSGCVLNATAATPTAFSWTFTFTGGTGVFAGASGGGTGFHVGRTHLSGTLTLP